MPNIISNKVSLIEGRRKVSYTMLENYFQGQHDRNCVEPNQFKLSI